MQREVKNTITGKQGWEATYDFGAICKNPAELTALSLFRRETKAELWGSNIKRPYKHLNK